MTTTPSRRPLAGDVIALTVHGWRGVLDLTVPVQAPLAAVSQAYAAQAGLDRPPVLVGRAGETLEPATTVADAGLVAGSVVAAVGDGPPAPRSGVRPVETVPGHPSAAWCLGAVLVALVAGWVAAQLPAGADRLAPVVLLAAAAVLGCLPFGPMAAQRASAAPAFAAAACFGWLWEPVAEQLPAVVGASALAAAATAGVARALGDGAEERLRVWIVTGVLVFAVAALGVLTSQSPHVVWAVLLAGAVLAARWVPVVALDVPDRFLLDLDRLAVTAWSAHDVAGPAREPEVVHREAVAAAATRAGRTVVAAAAAIMVVAGSAAPLLLWHADVPVDQVGARCLVGFGGAALLFAARSHRHPAAKLMLRIGGVVGLTALAVRLLTVLGADQRSIIAGGAVLLALVLVLVAVLVGRGWRSAWWSRNADVAETVCGACALGAVVVAVGLFRYLWTMTS